MIQSGMQQINQIIKPLSPPPLLEVKKLWSGREFFDPVLSRSTFHYPEVRWTDSVCSLVVQGSTLDVSSFSYSAFPCRPWLPEFQFHRPTLPPTAHAEKEGDRVATLVAFGSECRRTFYRWKGWICLHDLFRGGLFFCSNCFFTRPRRQQR